MPITFIVSRVVKETSANNLETIQIVEFVAILTIKFTLKAFATSRFGRHILWRCLQSTRQFLCSSKYRFLCLRIPFYKKCKKIENCLCLVVLASRSVNILPPIGEFMWLLLLNRLRNFEKLIDCPFRDICCHEYHQLLRHRHHV